LSPGDVGEVRLEPLRQSVGDLADSGNDRLTSDLKDTVGHEAVVPPRDEIGGNCGELVEILQRLTDLAIAPPSRQAFVWRHRERAASTID
jgi:hypothetical protein